MENMKPATPAAPAVSQGPATKEMQKEDHWLIQVVGGLTLANTIVSALAVFTVFLYYGIA